MNYLDICGPQKLCKYRMKADTQIMEFFCFCLRPTPPNHRTLLNIDLISSLFLIAHSKHLTFSPIPSCLQSQGWQTYPEPQG